MTCTSFLILFMLHCSDTCGSVANSIRLHFLEQAWRNWGSLFRSGSRAYWCPNIDACLVSSILHTSKVINLWNQIKLMDYSFQEDESWKTRIFYSGKHTTANIHIDYGILICWVYLLVLLIVPIRGTIMGTL